MVDDTPEESSGSAARARRDIDAALDKLADLDEDLAAEIPDAVVSALSAAKDALSAERTECRKQTPYSPMTLVGGSGGLRYICDHEPKPHEYPA